MGKVKKTNCNVCYDHTSLPWQLDIKVDTVLEVLRRNAPGGEYSYPAAHSHAPAFFLRRGAALSSAHRSGLSYLRAKKAVLDSFSPTGGKNESRTAKKNPTILGKKLQDLAILRPALAGLRTSPGRRCPPLAALARDLTFADGRLRKDAGVVRQAFGRC